jgi:hypothetical protein
MAAVKPPKGDELPVCVLQDFKKRQGEQEKKAKEEPKKKKAKPMKQIRVGVSESTFPPPPPLLSSDISYVSASAAAHHDYTTVCPE